MKSEFAKRLSLFIIVVAFVAFVYGIYQAILIVDKRQIGTSDGIYTNHVANSEKISAKARLLTQGCQNRVCQVQRILDYVTDIPYKINRFQANSPQNTIQKNFGDCDDKSNLLISMLHTMGIEAYFVLVPKHIFVIAHLKDPVISEIPGLWIDGKKYYILESTAKGSSIGFPLHHKIKEIEAIFEPFSNRKLHYRTIEYKP